MDLTILMTHDIGGKVENNNSPWGWKRGVEIPLLVKAQPYETKGNGTKEHGGRITRHADNKVESITSGRRTNKDDGYGEM
jgi:hypothetical protein